MLGKVPGGKSQLASIVAAYWLIKESYVSKTSVKQEELEAMIDMIEQKNITMVEEELEIEKFLKIMEDGGAAAIANTTGAASATDQATVKLNKKGKPVSGIIGKMYRRKNPVQMGQ